MNTTESNELIAEFLGWYPTAINKTVVTLKFHSSWDWLMKVVEKIENLGYEVRIERISCKINELSDKDNPIVSWVCGNISNKIGLTYKAIVEFIQWYNQQK